MVVPKTRLINQCRVVVFSDISCFFVNRQKIYILMMMMKIYVVISYVLLLLFSCC